jgi:hypothetical protein
VAVRGTLADGSRRAARTVYCMWGWIWIVVAYVLGMGFFHWLGGIGAAGDAIKSWGAATGERRRRASSSASL